MFRLTFIDGRVIRLAEDRGGGREEQMFDALAHHRVQQLQSVKEFSHSLALSMTLCEIRGWSFISVSLRKHMKRSSEITGLCALAGPAIGRYALRR